MEAILNIFEIEESITFWDLYIYEEGSPLTENEVLWICKRDSTKYNDHYYLKRSMYFFFFFFFLNYLL